MAVFFPSKPDIKLENAPLDEVVCQIRFPQILRINTEDPSEFQDEIRSLFPQLVIEHGFLFLVSGPGSAEVPPEEKRTKIFRFRSKDEHITVSLAADFYAISTTQYSHWTDFASFLNLVADAILRIYQPSYSTRIGLRYINRLTLANTGLQGFSEIVDLLNPELTGYHRNPAWIDPLGMQFRLSLADGDARLTLRTEQGSDNNRQTFFLLDIDYFQEGQLPLSGLVERCDQYHDVIYNAFRWCIPEENLSVFKPVERVG